ncbi:hypothetical protein GCM10027406_14080 [Leifsonia lichenia]
MGGRAFTARFGLEKIGPFTVVGLLVLPLVVGGLLMLALWNPSQNLNRVTAAIVNDDLPVSVNGQTVPLGRQFAAGLIGGGASSASGQQGASPDGSANDTANLSWVLTNDSDAKDGLAAGRYVAVVTIPPSFSADATSISGPAADARKATLHVTTSPASALLDPTVTAAVVQAATTSLNTQLTSQYLSNVYGAFNTIGEQIGQAATGAQSVASGADSLASGAQSAASGAASLSAGLVPLDAGASSLAAGLAELSAAAAPLPGQTEALAQGAGGLAGAAGTASGSVAQATQRFSAVVARICQTPGRLCDDATNALASLEAAKGGVAQFAAGADQVAAGNAALASAMPTLVAGIDSSASGAASVASGAAQADSGASTLATGTASVAAGATQVDAGATQLAQSLAEAAQKIPAYSDSDILTLSAVAAHPVDDATVRGHDDRQTAPLLAVIALWVGGLATALARRSVPTSELLSTRSSVRLAAQSASLTALVGVGQGALVAAAAQVGLGLTPGGWLGFTLLCCVTGAVFGLLNQGLAAAFGAVGRLVAVIVALVAFGAGLTSTVPPVLAGFAGSLPTASGLAVLQLGIGIGDANGGALAGAVVAVVAWGAVGLALVWAGVAARRGIRVRGRAVDAGGSFAGAQIEQGDNIRQRERGC